MPDAELVKWATDAKSFISEAGEGAICDERLMRAAVTFGMLLRRGFITARTGVDDMDRSHAIALIAAGFDDFPPSTPNRAELFAAVLVR